MIKKVHLVSFKGFEDFTVELCPFTNLVGLNSRGKTTILQAVKFVYDHVRAAFGNREVPAFDARIQWDMPPDRAIQRISFNDAEALWLNRKTSVPCQVVLTLDDETEVDARLISVAQCLLDFRRGGRAFRTSSLQGDEKEIITKFIRNNVAFVPPIGGASPNENFISYSHLESELGQGRVAETFRNNLYWLYNDGDKDRFHQVVEMVNRYIPQSRILPPRLSHDNPARALVEFEEAGQKYDISASGAGLRTLINLASVLLLSDSQVMLIDEPDAHLHSSMQRAVARMLVDYVAEREVQVIVATHAPDFIAEVPAESLMWIDRSEECGRVIDDVGRALIDLGAVSKSDMVMGGTTKAVLYVEGNLDRRILSEFYRRSGLKNPFDVSGQVLVTKLPDGKSSAKAVKYLRKMLKNLLNVSIPVVALCDLDYELANEEADSYVLTLPRKEIENYLLDAAAFAAAAKAAAESRQNATNSSDSFPTTEEVNDALQELIDNEQQSLRDHLIWQHRETLSDSIDSTTKEMRANEWFSQQWEDQKWRLERASGKTVLKNLRDWCQKKYKLTVTSDKLIGAISTVPPELREILKKVVDGLENAKG